MAQSAGVLEKLGQPGHYTLFAPTNKAFEGLGREVLDRLRGDKGALKGKTSGQKDDQMTFRTWQPEDIIAQSSTVIVTHEFVC